MLIKYFFLFFAECLHRFGQNCEKVCHCQHGECDNITGVCYEPGCMKGWTGDSCNYSKQIITSLSFTLCFMILILKVFYLKR